MLLSSELRTNYSRYKEYFSLLNAKRFYASPEVVKQIMREDVSRIERVIVYMKHFRQKDLLLRFESSQPDSTRDFFL